MAQSYSSKTNAALISGLSSTDVLDIHKTTVDRYIETLCNRNFGVANSQIDYFDIEKYQSIIQLYHFPVITLSSLRDNYRDANYTDLVEDTDFTCDYRAGLIKLIRDDFNILKGTSGFSVGDKMVKVTYTYGYSSVPEEVSTFADWMLAMLAETKKITGATKNADGAMLRSVKIGDYEEAYFSDNKEIDKKYQTVLSEMTRSILMKYKFWGETDGNYIQSL